MAWAVIYDTQNGGTGVINVFKSKKVAEKQVKIAKKSKSFTKLGYSNPRIKKEPKGDFE